MDLWEVKIVSLKYLTWTLNTPTDYSFTKWKDLDPTDNWYSTNWISKGDDSVRNSWSFVQQGFFNQVTNNTNKLYAIGLHEFTLDQSGNVLDKVPWEAAPSGANPLDYKILNSNESDIGRPVKKSLRYFMQQHPDIKWSFQVFCSKDKVNSYLDAVYDYSSSSIVTEFLRQYKIIFQYYILRGFPVKGAEIDFEKTKTRLATDPGSTGNDYDKFKRLLERVKNEVCLPLGLELRVNLLAMTGDYIPDYYAWHDYKTMASATDINGNQAVDEFQLMSYDFSWGGSAPGPSTPQWWLTEILDHVKNSLPPEKTYIGNAGYGRRWPLYNQNLGTSLDYKALMLLQNGMFVHNYQSDDKTTWYFVDQDFAPFCGFNDKDSSYQITYPHVYDRFKAAYGTMDTWESNPTMNWGTDKGYVTNFSKSQHPIFTGIQAVLNNPTLSGYYGNLDKSTGQLKPSIVNQPLSEGVDQLYYFNYWTIHSAKWSYNSLTQACELDTTYGTDGQARFDFNLATPGNYKLIALVGFPYYGQDHFDINVNGTVFTIGDNLPDWYKGITNPGTHMYDCGSWDFQASNTITVGKTNGAYIGGFIICQTYDSGFSGGSIEFPANLSMLKKRGTEDPQTGESEIIDAQFPQNLIVTGEILRRPPRPAIIWEDMFGPYLNGPGFYPGDSVDPLPTDLTKSGGAGSYQKCNPFFYDVGEGSNHYYDPDPNLTNHDQCITNTYPAGFSSGSWTVFKADDTDDANVQCDPLAPTPQLSRAQLVLNKKFKCDVQVEADLIMAADRPVQIGLRLFADQPGYDGYGYLIVLDWSDYTIKLIHEDNFVQTLIGSPYPMTDAMKLSKMNRMTLTAQVLNGNLTFIASGYQYITDLPLPNFTPGTTSGAHGVFISTAHIKLYRLTISTLNRYEPMEKIQVEVDGVAYATFGEVQRVSPYDQYDEFGWIAYTGKPGNLTAAVGAIPSDPDSTDSTEVEGRVGTIFETEAPGYEEKWNLDYRNSQLANVLSWIGKKNVKIKMHDPGIWLRTLYIGDSQGFSVSYNSDKIAFEKTVDQIRSYGVGGIGMWTLGQEDPMVFDYIDKIR